MIEIVNLTDKVLEISDNAKINPQSYLIWDSDITPRINQLKKMNLIRLQPASKREKKNTSYISKRHARYQENIEKLKNGYVPEVISLNVEKVPVTKVEKPKRNRRNINK